MQSKASLTDGNRTKPIKPAFMMNRGTQPEPLKEEREESGDGSMTEYYHVNAEGRGDPDVVDDLVSVIEVIFLDVLFLVAPLVLLAVSVGTGLSVGVGVAHFDQERADE
ncbi:hypothetical protein SLA2020_049960 [Shorea laevis]